jgi:hypothetical protein
MFILIYGLVLLFFWIKAARMKYENYCHVSEEIFANWKFYLRSSYKKFAALFLLQIIFAFIVGICGEPFATENHTAFVLSNTPIYFQTLVYIQLIYTAFIVIFTVFKVRKNYLHGKNVGIIGYIS